jgi:hypothetical protein
LRGEEGGSGDGLARRPVGWRLGMTPTCGPHMLVTGEGAAAGWVGPTWAVRGEKECWAEFGPTT